MDQCTSKIFLPLNRYASKLFCLSLNTTPESYKYIFIAKYSIVNLNNIYQFQDIRRIFMKTRACAYRWKNRLTEGKNTFQLFWKMLRRGISSFIARKKEPFPIIYHYVPCCLYLEQIFRYERLVGPQDIMIYC